jgi:predicted ATPase/class 3 adenylate cyclase
VIEPAAAQLPAGTVTFAFTDIESSTQRWDRNRFAMEDAVRRHDALMRAAIVRHGGYVFKTIGDAFCAAFSRPEEAVRAMLDAQRALAAEDFSAVDGLRVRVAIHTGTADERDRDYFGPAVNRVARLLGIAHGGQILLSGITSDLLAGSLPPKVSLRDLGEHRLRDLSRPEYVYQLVAPELAADFPPLRSLATLPNNLPLHASSFIGRELEIAEIARLIEKHRLVTIVGSGGVGKTRTSLQVAANLLDGSADGVWFIELAPLGSGDYLASTVAQTLGVALDSDGEATKSLVQSLKSKRMLLVFDNCEHLVVAAAATIAAILHGCPNVRILASSRQALGIEGEVAFRMPSLPIPAAIGLFSERAKAADSRFVLSDENAPIVAEICTRLDGIPLAIELAASRVKMLTPKQLRGRLDERFRVLTGGSRDVLPRQQTLRALIDWSHDLLDPRERALFRRVGIFVSGFTLEGCVAVGGGEFDEYEVFDVLASLVEKSLVLADDVGDVVRYRLLESTRAYAIEKLAEASERDAIESRHLAYLRDRFALLKADVDRTCASMDLLDPFEMELDDIRFALDAALRRSDVCAGAELLASVERSWEMSRLSREGIARIEAFVAALSDDERTLRARLRGTAAALLISLGNAEEAAEVASQAVLDARAGGDPETLAFALHCTARAQAFVENRSAAAAAVAEAQAIPACTTRLRLFLLDLSATLAALDGDFEAVAKVRLQLLDEWRKRGNVHNEFVQRFHLAILEKARDDTQSAIVRISEILPSLRRHRENAILGEALLFLASLLVETNDLRGADAATREAIEIFAAGAPEYFVVSVAVQYFALIFALQGDLERAAVLQGYAALALERIGTRRDRIGLKIVERLSGLLREGLPPQTRARLVAEGAALTPAAAIALALDAGAPASHAS